MATTIQIDENLKQKLDNIKIHHRETYNELINRMINNFSSEVDNESLIATIETLSDPELMKGIKESLKEEERGEPGTSLEDLKKELGI